VPQPTAKSIHLLRSDPKHVGERLFNHSVSEKRHFSPRFDLLELYLCHANENVNIDISLMMRYRLNCGRSVARESAFRVKERSSRAASIGEKKNERTRF
jgi:hypothetical protein